MRKRKDYIPRDKFELNNWAKHFAKVVTRNVGKYNITNEEKQLLEAEANNYNSDLETEIDLISQKKKQVKKTQDDRKSLINICRAIAQRVKASAEYNVNVGKEFDIIGSQRQIDVKNAKPVLKEIKLSYGWEFRFNLHDYFSGINIYRKHPDDDDFKFLATDTRSPYVDKDEMINNTQYFACFIIGDTEVGQKSDIITINV